jgi:hypothetical protein
VGCKLHKGCTLRWSLCDAMNAPCTVSITKSSSEHQLPPSTSAPTVGAPWSRATSECFRNHNFAADSWDPRQSSTTFNGCSALGRYACQRPSHERAAVSHCQGGPGSGVPRSHRVHSVGWLPEFVLSLAAAAVVCNSCLPASHLSAWASFTVVQVLSRQW